MPLFSQYQVDNLHYVLARTIKKGVYNSDSYKMIKKLVKKIHFRTDRLTFIAIYTYRPTWCSRQPRYAAFSFSSLQHSKQSTYYVPAYHIKIGIEYLTLKGLLSRDRSKNNWIVQLRRIHKQIGLFSKSIHFNNSFVIVYE